MTIATLLLDEEEARALTELTRAAMQSNGPTGPNAALYAALYTKVAHTSAIAHRAIVEEGAASVTIYNPANESAVIRLDLGTVDAAPDVTLRTLFTEAFETLLTLITVGALDDA